MPNVTVSVPEELKQELDKLPEVNWSEAVRNFLSEKVKRESLLRKLDKMLGNSRLTEEEADKFAVELGRQVKKGRFEKLKKLGLVE
ncbi:TPA: hypothetical protein HA231_03855 [Candidatus Woesearchaeota archaeon]|nr:hypothetical protein [Candidatus Woesearchaeota archaeon]